MYRPVLVALASSAVFAASAAVALPPLPSPVQVDMQAATHPGQVTVGCPFRTRSATDRNTGFLDSAAFYGVAQIPLSLPDGASIRIQGRFPKTRYMSLQSYDGFKGGNLIDSLPDALVVPSTGGALDPNPAVLPDAGGYTYTYQVTIRYAAPPAHRADREPNTLYVGAPAMSSPTRVAKQVAYRTYLPNPGSDITGDTPVPDMIYSGPSGDINFNNTPDAAKCDRINMAASLVRTYNAAAFPGRQIEFVPATNSNSTIPYPNGDASYLRAASARTYGSIVVVRTRAFRVPVLPDQFPTVTDPDVRYWSFCHYNLGSAAVIGCLADRDLVTQADGYNVVVVSEAAARPPLATRANGYNWIDSSGNQNQLLLLRQLLVRPGFSGDYALAVANSSEPVAVSLGEWAPEVTYCDPAVFAAYALSGGDALFSACQSAFYKPLPGGATVPRTPRL